MKPARETDQPSDMPPLRAEAAMQFSTAPYESGVLILVNRGRDDSFIETAVYAGKDYEHRTYISVTCQVGCAFGCEFCKVSELRLRRDISADEYFEQVRIIVEQSEAIEWMDSAAPIKVTFGRAGEPLHNSATVDAITRLAEQYACAFQFFSVFPDAPVSRKILAEILEFAASYDRTVQPVVSMHSSNEDQRKRMMSGAKLQSFQAISEFGRLWRQRGVKRKLSLSFALMEGTHVDMTEVARTFSPEDFAIRLALYIPSSTATLQLRSTSPIERLDQLDEDAQQLGYDVIRSPAGPIERIWDSRPYSGMRMLVGTVGTPLE